MKTQHGRESWIFSRSDRKSRGARRKSRLRVEALEGRALLASRLFALPLDNPYVITELDPQNGAEVGRFNAPIPADPSGANGLAFDGNVIYYMPHDGTNRLWQLDPDSGDVIHWAAVGDGNGLIDGLGVVDGKVYLQSPNTHELLVVDPASQAVVNRLNVAANLVGGLTGADDPNELVATESFTTAVRIDPATGAVLGQFGLPGPVYGAAFVDGKLYFGSSQGGQIYVTDRAGHPQTTLFAPYSVSALAGDGVEVDSNPDPEPGAERVVNGDFEQGNLFGWHTYTQPGSFGQSFYAYGAGAFPTRPLPLPPQGNFAATHDLNGPGTEILYQDIVLPAGQEANLSLLIQYNNRASAFYTPETLDSLNFPAGANQQIRIDIVDPSANLLSTSADAVLLSVFQTRPGDPYAINPTELNADLSAFAGRKVRLRIAIAQNVFAFDMIVDAVSVQTSEAPSTVDPTAYYIADLEEFGGGTGKIIRVDATTGAQTIVSAGGRFIDPYGVTEAPDGSLIVADQGLLGGTGTLFRVDPVTGTQTVITTDGYLVDPFEVVIAPDGNFLVADFGVGGFGRIVRVDSATGEQSLVSDAGMLFWPFGIATAPDGSIYVASSGYSGETGWIFRVDPVTGAQTLLATGGELTDPADVVVAPDGSLIVADPSALGGQGAIFRIDPVTGVQTLILGGGLLRSPIGLAMSPDGRLIVSGILGNEFIPALTAFDLATGEQTVIARGGPDWRYPAGIAVGIATTTTPPVDTPPTAYFIADVEDYGLGSGKIIRVDAATGAQTIVSSGGQFIDPYSVVEASDGSLIVVDQGLLGGTGTLFRVDPVTGTQTVISTGAYFIDPFEVVIAPDGSFLVADFGMGGLGRIVRVDPTSGEQTLVSDVGMLQRPFGIASAPDGSIYVASYGYSGETGQVFRVDPVTGAQTLIATGGALVDPVDVVVAPDGSLIVADESALGGQGAIFRIDPVTGIQTLILEGGLLRSPIGLAMSPDGRLIVSGILRDEFIPALTAVDLATGEQTVIARGGPDWRFPMGIAVGVATTTTPPVDTPPTAVAGGPYTVEEGAAVALDASGTTDPDQDPASLTYLWDLNGNGVFGETGSAATRGDEVGVHPIFSALGLPGGITVPVSLEVTDAKRQKSLTTSTITIDNRPPIVTLGPDVTVDAAAPFLAHGSFTDPGAGENFRASVDYGDGAGLQELSLNPDRTFDLSHVYFQAGTYHVVVFVTDGNGGTDQSSLVVTVNPLTPVLYTLVNVTIPYGQDVVTLHGVVAGSAGGPRGDVVVSLAGDTRIAAIDPATGEFQVVFSTATLGARDLPYSIAYSYTGDGTYRSVSVTSGGLLVTPRALTIIADDVSKVYGEPDPLFSASFDGFAPGEGPNVLDGTLVFATTGPADNLPAGLYAILPSGLSSPNYAITILPGTLTVLQATMAFSEASAPTFVVGTSSASFTGKLESNSVLPVGQPITATILGANGPLASGTGTVDSAGRFSVTLATGTLPVGSFTVRYEYAGDPNFKPIIGTVDLHVTTALVEFYDPTKAHRAGKAVSIKIGVRDALGNSLVSSSLDVTAVQIVDAQGTTYTPNAKGNANSDGVFRKSGSQYKYKLDTTGLAPGRYTLLVTIGDDPVKHALTFVVK